MKTLYKRVKELVVASDSAVQKAKKPCPKRKNGKHNWGGGRFAFCPCGARKGADSDRHRK